MMYAFSPRPLGYYLRVFALACMVLLPGACGSDPAEQQAPPPPPVTTTEAHTDSVEYRVDYPGRVRGATEVAVRARVSGILKQRRFEEGTAVTAGQTLFQIEPGTYEDRVKSAEAELADAQAQQLRAEREWERVRDLFQGNAVSERERDQARADHGVARARLEAAKSALSNAERELRYARVEAPISGVASLEAVTEGNLVEAGTVLTHVIQHDPVHVYFALPEGDAIAWHSGTEQVERSVEMIVGDGSPYLHSGEVDFSDRRLDPMTGSVQMRAVFPNPDGELIPGQFVRVRLTLETFEAAVLVDPIAVTEGPEGPQVFTVEGGQAKALPVTLGPMIGDRQVVLSGIPDGSHLVVNGQVAITDGALVKVTNGDDQEG